MRPWRKLTSCCKKTAWPTGCSKSTRKAKWEIRVASLFKQGPEEFLKMICVHELAHLKERLHDKAFYQLCTYMEPRYHQLECELCAAPVPDSCLLFLRHSNGSTRDKRSPHCPASCFRTLS